MDGNGPGVADTLTYGGSITFGGIPNITVGRSGSLIPYTQAGNRVVNPTNFASMSAFSDGVTVNPLNGYGLQISQNMTLNSGATVNVGGAATASDVTQGLNLTGTVSGSSGITKTGNGTLRLGADDSGTLAGGIAINQGIISISADNQLGNAANAVTINATTGTAGLRSTGTFSSARAINFNNGTAANNIIEVADGAALTLNGVNAITNATGFVKRENGTLVIASSQNFAGTVTINAGALQVSDAGALGTTVGNTTVANNVGAAVQINGGVGGLTIAEPLTIDGAGLNSAGALQSLAGGGTNIVHRPDRARLASTIGADFGFRS